MGSLARFSRETLIRVRAAISDKDIRRRGRNVFEGQ